MRFRDSRTGRFVSKATYEHSRARGGTRYYREYYRVLPPRVRREVEEEIEMDTIEYQGAFDTGKGRRRK